MTQTIEKAPTEPGSKTMKKTWGATVALLVAAGIAPGTTAGQEVHRLSGAEVAVYNLAGTTRIVRGSGSDVVIRVTRGGADAARLEIESGPIGGRETLRVVYPADQVVYPEMGRGSRSQLRVREDGTFGGSGRSGGDQVEIRGSGRGLEAWADLVIEVPAGKDVAAYVAAGDMDARGLQGTFRFDTGSGSVDVTDVTGRVVVDTGSGSATVTGVRGYVNVDTGSGNVTLQDVEGDEIGVDTGSGTVRGSGLTGERLHVDTGSGGIRLDGVSVPDVMLDTGSGSVEITLLRDVDVLEIDTGSGTVTVYAPEDLGGQVELDTGSGGIDMDFAVEVRRVRRDRVVGVLGDGRGTIRIDTGSGNVRLLRR